MYSQYIPYMQIRLFLINGSYEQPFCQTHLDVTLQKGCFFFFIYQKVIQLHSIQALN